MGDALDRAEVKPQTDLDTDTFTNTNSAGSKCTNPVIREILQSTSTKMYSSKEADEIMHSVAKLAGDTNVDWEKRVTMIKTLRCVCADPLYHPQLVSYLRHLSPSMQAAVKDLRSQLSREACVAVSGIAYWLRNRSECFVEPMIPTLFGLLVANAKIVSTTGLHTINAVYEYVPSWRLIPPLQVQMASKSKDIRRAVSGAIKLILFTWPGPQVQKQAHQIVDLLKKGLVDADLETRSHSRDAFAILQSKYPHLSTSVMDALDTHQKRQLQGFLATNKTPIHPLSTPLSNGPSVSGYSSLSRQGSLRKTSIPVLASRASPQVVPGSQGRSTSAIDLQAVNRAKQHHFSTMRSPLRQMGRTHSSMAPSPSNSAFSTPRQVVTNSSQIPTLERSRTRGRMSRLSQSQPGSRSNSPSSKPSYAMYANDTTPTAPYHMNKTGTRKMSSASSASSSRETSPQGRIMASKLRSRSISNSPQIQSNTNSSTAKMLLASREAESLLTDISAYNRDSLEIDANHSDSEDSMSSHLSNRSFLSDTFSPSNVPRHVFLEDNVEELLSRCGSAKWSERKEGLLGLKEYLKLHGSIPKEHFNRIGQTFCRIFMDAHTKVLSIFLDVLHAVLNRHAKDLVDFTSILLNRILTKMGSDLLTSVHQKLIKTLDIIMDEMPAEVQFTAVTHYLCDPTQTPNSRSKVAALSHLYNLISTPVAVKVNELQVLVDKLLEWSVDMRSQELRRTSQKVFYSLFGMAAPQMTLVLGQMSSSKQDQAKTILKNIGSQESSIQLEAIDTCGWSAINSGIESLRINETGFIGAPSTDLFSIIAEITLSPAEKKGLRVNELYSALKSAPDEILAEHHKDLLKVIFDALSDCEKPSDKALCYYCLEELSSRSSLSQALAAFAELFIVRVTDVGQQSPREVTKAAESCAMSVASKFPPDIIVRALCPIIQNSEFPVNQMAIKMLQKLCDCCEVNALRAQIAEIMTTLVLAYDHPDSAVRKAAVFAIVSAHSRLGGALDPYLASLSGSKLKLLQLYIQRAQQSAS